MNNTIWKFPLAPSLVMPTGARLLDVQMQDGYPILWAEVDASPEANAVTRNLAVVGTGWPDSVLATSKYVGTYQDGSLVFHVYDLGETGSSTNLDSTNPTV